MGGVRECNQDVLLCVVQLMIFVICVLKDRGRGTGAEVGVS